MHKTPRLPTIGLFLPPLTPINATPLHKDYSIQHGDVNSSHCQVSSLAQLVPKRKFSKVTHSKELASEMFVKGRF